VVCDNGNMSKILFPEIAKEIIKMAKQDQAMRFVAQEDKNKWNPEIDKKNTQKLKEIVTDVGWPTISRVGLKASNKAWLLIQHADKDLDFQKKCLILMKNEGVDEVNSVNVAYLEDRVRVAEGNNNYTGRSFTEILKLIN